MKRAANEKTKNAEKGPQKQKHQNQYGTYSNDESVSDKKKVKEEEE